MAKINSLEPWELIFILFCCALIISPFVSKLIIIKNIFTFFFGKVFLWVQSNWSFLILLIIAFFYVSNKIHKKIKDLRRAQREKDLAVKEEREKVEEILKEDISCMVEDNLEIFANNIKNLNLSYTLPIEIKGTLKNKLIEVQKKLIEVRHKNNLSEIESIKEGFLEEIKILERKKFYLDMEKKMDREKILNKLDIYSNSVFEKSLLNKIEIDALKKDGYKQKNEYCVKDNKVITVLVKPPLNHSLTHTFLVWSVRKLLEEYGDIKHINEYLTREADLNFKIKGKLYAIEIETGALLGKKKQLKEKIDYMNSKYGNRWIFLVSNRKLLQKFKKYAKTSQRKDLRENLDKWAKI